MRRRAVRATVVGMIPVAAVVPMVIVTPVAAAAVIGRSRVVAEAEIDIRLDRSAAVPIPRVAVAAAAVSRPVRRRAVRIDRATRCHQSGCRGNGKKGKTFHFATPQVK